VSGVEALFAHCQQAGLNCSPLKGDPARMRVFGLGDPDGNLLWLFGLPSSPVHRSGD
jgi:hypothetical protein